MLTTLGRRYLGGAIGQTSFEAEFIEATVADFAKRTKKVADIAKTQPQAAYAAFIRGEIGRWVYGLKVSSITSDEVFQPLEEAIVKYLIPALTGQHAPSQEMRNVIALPT